jgi:hypothetical protein
MHCPHCQQHFSPQTVQHDIGQDQDGRWRVSATQCDNEECERWILELVRIQTAVRNGALIEKAIPVRMIHPKTGSRPLDEVVPASFRDEFAEAVVVMGDSAKASAALSRRSLQNLLRTKAGVKEGNLSGEIQEVLDSEQLPSWLADDLDAVRNVGNFAAHPIKSTQSGEIVEVEPGEAEWLLDVLESLFDHFFVKPQEAEKRREALNAKLQEAGKPPMHAPPPAEETSP